MQKKSGYSQKSCIFIYQLNCCCDNSYIGLTTRQLKKRFEYYTHASVEKFLRIFKYDKENKYVKIIKAVKRSDTAEHLVFDQSFAEKFNLDRFKIIKGYSNIFDLIKMEAIRILNRKPTLFRRKLFALFT